MRGSRFEVRGSRFDALVDATVREMLDVEPRADLRSRVLARVFQPSFVASAFRRKLLVTASIAAAVMLLVLLWLPARKLPVADRPVPKQAQVINAPETRPQSSPAVRANDVTQIAASRARPIPSATRVAAGVPRAPEMPPLTQIAPIEIASVTTSPIAPKELAIEPLAPIAEVEVAPLNPPDRRN